MFRSPGTRASPRIPKSQVPEGPIHDFTTIIETTAQEDWQKRTAALATLVSTIPPAGPGGGRDGYEAAPEEAWYNSPPTLRHLALPLAELLRDPRSTVVKRTCESLDLLFSRCRADARYLLKDLMVSILQVHAATVQVIRSYVQATVLMAMAVVPCKMAMPIWLDRLKNDKSRTLREACALYLSAALAEWTEEGYLTREIYLQVGTALIRALGDSSPAVRANSKRGLEILGTQRGDLLDALADDPELTRDPRVRRLLQRIQAGEAVGDDSMSVASRSSRVSAASAPARGFRAGTGSSSLRNAALTANRISQRRGGPGVTHSGSPPSALPRSGIPATIGVSASPSPENPGRKLPPTRSASSSATIQSRGGPGGGGDGAAAAFGIGGSLGPPRRVLTGTAATGIVAASNGAATLQPSSSTTLAFRSSFDSTPNPPALPSAPSALTTDDGENGNLSFDTAETDVSELQPIASTTELRLVAKSRGMNSRRSSLLHDRLLRSSSSNLPSSIGSLDQELQGMSLNGAPIDVANMPADSSEIIANHPGLPEHTKIAHELLEAHKVHVDQVMEVLKVEMDALKDFELILLEEGPRRPTEEEVLEYFESLGLCLEQRTKAATIFQKKMDRISMGR